MTATQRAALAAATLFAVLPAGIAGATGSYDDGKSKPKHGEDHVKSGHDHGKDKPKKIKCHKGKGYEVQGTLADGSSLEQVSGAGTRRRSDDRFSGTLVVEVVKGNKRGRRDIGLSSYAVESVKVRGSASEAGVPAVGTRVLLVGKQVAPACPTDPKPTPTPTPSPTPMPTTTPVPTPDPEEPVATLTWNEGDHPKYEDKPGHPGHEDDCEDKPEPTPTPTPTPEPSEPSDYPSDYPIDYPSADYPSDEAEEPTPVTDVRISLVRFATAK